MKKNVCFQGLPSIFPFIGARRKVSLKKEDLLLLLSCDNPNQPPETSKLHPDSQKAIEAIGKFVFLERM